MTVVPSMLHHQFYISRSLASADAVEQLLARARQQNPQRGLTGALVFTGGHFAQLLEGPPAVLAETMALIERDSRHEAVRCLLGGPIAERHCDAWDMAFLSAPGVDDLLHQLLQEPFIAPERSQRLLRQLLGLASKPAVTSP